MIDLKQIQYFLACVETGSFSKAAELLFTTQPSVSKIIKAMEDEMSVLLFERYSKGIGLTPEGEKIYGYAKNIMENIEKIEKSKLIKKMTHLSISYNPGLWFDDVFVDFFHEHEHEDICYQVYSAETREIIQRVKERTDDVGFMYVMKNQFPAFQYYLVRNYMCFEPLLQTDVVIYMGEDFHKEKKDKFQLSEIRLIRRFMDEFSPENYREILDEQGNCLSDMEAVVTTNSDYIINRLLKNSNLVNISGAYCNKIQKSKNIVKFSEGENGKLVYGYVFRRGEKMPYIVSSFVEFLKEKLSKETR